MQRATFLTTFFLIGFGGAFLMFDFATGFLTTFLTTFFATGCGQARMVSEGEEAYVAQRFTFFTIFFLSGFLAGALAAIMSGASKRAAGVTAIADVLAAAVASEVGLAAGTTNADEVVLRTRSEKGKRRAVGWREPAQRCGVWHRE